MGRIFEVKVRWGYTKNIGNYESVKADVEYGETIGQNETPAEVTDRLEALCKTEVKRIIKNKSRKLIEQKNKSKWEDYY